MAIEYYIMRRTVHGVPDKRIGTYETSLQAQRELSLLTGTKFKPIPEEYYIQYSKDAIKQYEETQNANMS